MDKKRFEQSQEKSNRRNQGRKYVNLLDMLLTLFCTSQALTPDRTPPKKTKRERSTPVTCETSKSQSLKNSLGHTETIGVMTSTDVSTAPAHYFTILPDRSAKSSKALKFVGAHVGISGGPQNAIREALAINAKAFALFVRSARTWKCPPLAEEAVEAFKEKLVESELNPQMIVVHGSYLINPGGDLEYMYQIGLNTRSANLWHSNI